eukprot:CAMPEP_0197178620 /NCGR_PEP_ID=MMETSP1423-20130617/3848_1 /TAXON_ID=476441 /ORGANISM="Pseudo-nitzschia heimii, Strain UNC1101" /LENGTH=89 /DNA_ID=CAMNT_0042628397 /DNA_START=73 /DNA_END=339 /DNA_ORIENTATION=+
MWCVVVRMLFPSPFTDAAKAAVILGSGCDARDHHPRASSTIPSTVAVRGGANAGYTANANADGAVVVASSASGRASGASRSTAAWVAAA